jgi:hypothetical protein
LWRVAYALRRAHYPRPDGFCECRAFWPCTAATLAERALHSAYDRPVARLRPRSATRTINIGRWTG